MVRINAARVGALALLGTVGALAACSADEGGSTAAGAGAGGVVAPDPVADAASKQSADASTSALADASSPNPAPDAATLADAAADASARADGAVDPDSSGAVMVDLGETDVGCGGGISPPCAVGKHCLLDRDCDVACNYAGVCVSAPSCKTHLGGDTCGLGEVGAAGAMHESCCRSLPIPGYADPSHPGKTTYLDKYEITAGRIRSWVAQMAAANAGDIKGWVASHRPQIWDPAWEAYLPSGDEGGTLTIGRRLLGDPRPEDRGAMGPPGPGVILPPATDQVKNMGLNYQFGSEVYVDLHGSDCGTWVGSYGFPTYFYPADILARNGQAPRTNGVGLLGEPIAAQDLLDVKSMNCITNAMLAAFCAWDDGQLATGEALDFVTATPASLGNVSGCGVQYDNHGALLGNSFVGTVQTGGRCAPVALVNATFDAGDHLPVVGSPLNAHNYHYPDLGNQTSDKAWEIAAPGRGSQAAFGGGQADVVRINAGDEPWMDLNGNVSEAALDMTGAMFTGNFALKYRGIGYGTARSDLNTTYIKGETILRLQRPEAKAAYTGGRCMRFR